MWRSAPVKRARPASGRRRARRGHASATGTIARGTIRRAIRWPFLLRRRSVRLLLLVLALAFGLLELRQNPLLNPSAEPYRREAYAHWLDRNGDCRDTRATVLARDSLIPVTWDEQGCRVVSGRWRDPWSGWETSDPSALDIDHMIPLAEAHRSGADRWDAARRSDFANDLSVAPRRLVPVQASLNRSKADRDPVDWLPPDWRSWCAYAADWRAVKQAWELREDWAERQWLNLLAGVCRPGQR